ncbi:MAG: glycosyltransferase [Bacteroidales bacterium]|nr:glycosyltransferase [Bacteroidales bacterium]
MRISIITATYNSAKTITRTLESVKSQTYSNIEHIIIDGKSTDETLDIVRNYKHVSKIFSEKDEGIYFALNKGLEIATGDIIGFLHADDFFPKNNIIEKIAYTFKKQYTDILYGNLQYVSQNNTEKIIRNWESCKFEPNLLKKGWMPPHPTFYAKKHLYKSFGNFNTNFKIAADYDLMLRFLKQNISTFFMPEIIVKMRLGGVSNRSIKTIIKKSREDYQAIKNNKIGGFFTLINKNISKISQFSTKKTPYK